MLPEHPLILALDLGSDGCALVGSQTTDSRRTVRLVDGWKWSGWVHTPTQGKREPDDVWAARYLHWCREGLREKNREIRDRLKALLDAYPIAAYAVEKTKLMPSEKWGHPTKKQMYRSAAILTSQNQCAGLVQCVLIDYPAEIIPVSFRGDRIAQTVWRGVQCSDPKLLELGAPIEGGRQVRDCAAVLELAARMYKRRLRNAGAGGVE